MIGVGMHVMLAMFQAEPAPVSAQGTYEIEICVEPCSPSDRNDPDVRGLLVLFDEPLNLSALPTEEREYLESESLFLLYDDQEPTACFVLEPLKETTMIGLITVGLTSWNLTSSVLTVTLYRSPDASDTAYGILTGERISAGEAEASRLRASSQYHRDFLAGRRIGEPDIAPCVAAAREAVARNR